MEPIINQQISMPEKKNKTWLWIVIIIFVALLAGAGVYYWQNMEAKKLAQTIEDQDKIEQQKITTSEEKLNNCEQQLATASSTLSTLASACSGSKTLADQVKFALYAKSQIIPTNIKVQKVSLEDDKVYYTDEANKKVGIVQSTKHAENEIRNVTYKKAELSPNKQFIMLGSTGWEWQTVEIFDITTGQLQLANASGANFAEWTADNKLKVIGACGMGISCGIYQSIDNTVPWILEKIEDYKE